VAPHGGGPAYYQTRNATDGKVFAYLTWFPRDLICYRLPRVATTGLHIRLYSL
jgi:hypothetical protein